MSDIVAMDIGGTHARFAYAGIEGGRVSYLEEPYTLKTSDFRELRDAWEQFRRQSRDRQPSGAAIAFAGPVGGDRLKLTNNAWEIRPASLAEELGVERCHVVNDFGAVAHAVACLPESDFRHIGGPDEPLPNEGVISVVGPGTGLGVAQLLRRDGRDIVIDTEGGHIHFAPLDVIEDLILAHLRGRHGRVSVERVVAGAGLANIHEALSAAGGREVDRPDEKSLWHAALDRQDAAAAAALDRFLLSLGSVAGDLALAHGASGVVIAGGLGLRLRDRLAASGFHARFVAKGRYQARMEEMPVKLLTHEQPGLYGAAAAFAQHWTGKLQS